MVHRPEVVAYHICQWENMPSSNESILDLLFKTLPSFGACLPVLCTSYLNSRSEFELVSALA
jgi:hypothetical protein